jgi:PAS domain S-box-containing protein
MESKMKENNSKSKSSDDLRKKAEEKLRHMIQESLSGVNADDPQVLIQELQIHQIELEMQNEELRIAQTALEESRSKYSDLYDFAPVGYFTIDKSGLILEVNLTGAGLLGIERRSLIKKPFSIFLHKGDKDTFYMYRKQILEKKKRHTCEVRLKRKDKSEFNAQLVGIAVEDSEGNELCRTSVIDITDRKRAEEELKQKVKELARSNSDLERFAYIASHDLKSPLLSIGGFSKMLKEKYKNKLDKDAHKHIDFIVNSTVRMEALINDLLNYSRIATASRKLNPIDVNKIVVKAIANLTVEIERNRAKVTHDSLPTVMGNDFQIEQLFQNLIGNAIKFRSQEPPRVHISVEQQGEDWVFSVKDNGIGIASENRVRIFNIYQRLKRGEYEGAGIGLATCKKIVEIHGGRIWVESELVKGSVFYFTIPQRQDF